jgi:ABC-type ATPase with predicted acetyltransferase domain
MNGMKCVLDVAFNTHVERTPRVLEVAEAFGIGLDDKKFVLFDNVPLTLDCGDVVYITGQSGSGKSVMLRELQRQLEAVHEQTVVNIDKFELPEVPLVEQIGANTQEALEMLSRVGINDAYLFIRKPSELSDGQRYRLRLAHLVTSPARVWVADEFGAILDRTTAKIVAFSLSKMARSLNKILIVATTHMDLEEELAPTYRVDKRFREKMTIKSAK